MPPKQDRLQLPAFWTKNPEVWFIQAEAQFASRGVTSDLTKFNDVVCALDQETAGRLIDFLRDPPENEKYGAIKNLLLGTFGLTRRDRAAKLLHMAGLGDRKPSELMNEMLSLLDGHKPCMLFEQLFLEKLPESIRLLLSDADFTNTAEVGKKADALWESARLCEPSSIHRIQSSTAQHSVTDPKFKKFAHPVADKSTAEERKKKGWCFFHYRFEHRAKKCQQPCTYDQGNEQAGRQ